MARPVVLSNGQLFVGLDEHGLVHDFYYPYVGYENLTNARSLQHKIGVWVEDKFSWVDDGSWDISVDFEQNALISDIKLVSSNLQVSLQFKDFVDSEHTAFIRNIKVENLSDEQRDIRVFMHQVFQISRRGRADTALFSPKHRYILNYKGRRCLAIAGKIDNTESFDQFAVGSYQVDGKNGTFYDAEDGELSGNLVEHGGVDSVLRFRREVGPRESFNIDYWIVADPEFDGAQEIHNKLKQESIEHRMELVRNNFSQWIAPALEKISPIEDELHREMILKSLLIIKAHCDEKGSILASGDSSIFNYGKDYYCYCWPRDAVYALQPLIRLGIFEEARRFYKFTDDVTHEDGYLFHKYQPDRAVGSSWHPLMRRGEPELAIQEDETACVIISIFDYFSSSGDEKFAREYFDKFIKPASDFLVSFVDEQTSLPHASYDLWEEKFLTTTYSLSITIGALDSAVALAKKLDREEESHSWRIAAEKFRSSIGALYHPDGFFRKGYLLSSNGDLEYDNTIDISSLYGPYKYAGLLPVDERVLKTAKTVEKSLLDQSPSGGVIRHQNDGFFLSDKQYSGNPWIVCTMWLAQFYIGQNKLDQAKNLVDWALNTRLQSGVLSEQFDAGTCKHVGVTPLVWSHAEVVKTLLDLYKI